MMTGTYLNGMNKSIAATLLFGHELMLVYKDTATTLLVEPINLIFHFLMRSEFINLE
jgi:hypothetical protein